MTTASFKASLKQCSDAELVTRFRQARWGSVEASTIGWEIHCRQRLAPLADAR